MTKLTKKVFALFLLTGGLSIALALLGALSDERAARRESVVSDIARSSAGAQTIMGPVIIEEIERASGDARTTEHRYRRPRRLEIHADAAVHMRQRGIFVVPTFTSAHVVTGDFGASTAAEGEIVKSTRLVLDVSDRRGLVRAPTLRFGGVDVELVPGGSASHLDIHAELDREAGARGGAFEIHLELAGTRELRWSPAADDAVVHLRSAWPHPSFVGEALPAHREVSASGFEASWRAHPFQGVAGGDVRGGSLAGLSSYDFGVAFVSPADTYAQVNRAIKYGFLFVTLTFAVFAVFEVIKGLPIHVVQYGMVGVALVLFFLLLLSLSEHVHFASAYLVASAACIGLLTFYLRHVLAGWRRSAGFGAMFAALYGTLYVLLQLEEYALLVGSGVLFALLTAVMIVTRRVDWSSVGEPAALPLTRHPYRSPAAAADLPPR